MAVVESQRKKHKRNHTLPIDRERSTGISRVFFYLEEQVTRVADNQFNAYCVDCMRNQSTYFELKHGIFICEACAGWHNQIFPYGKHYLKEIYTEVWDPYQLKVLSIASNEDWFKLCQSYRME